MALGIGSGTLMTVALVIVAVLVALWIDRRTSATTAA